MIGRPIVVLAFAASLVLPLACAKRESEEIETTGVVTVSVATAHRGTIRAVVTATAVVKPASGAELDVVPPAGARIAEMPVGVGDRVAKGGLLVKFEVPSLAAELGARESEAKSAEAGAAIARKALERQSYLVQRGIAAQKEVQAAERDLVDAEAALVASKESLDAARSLAARCIARAPFDGVVASRTHNPGDLVEPGADPILRFVDPSRLEVEASVPVDGPCAIEAEGAGAGDRSAAAGSRIRDRHRRPCRRRSSDGDRAAAARLRGAHVAPLGHPGARRDRLGRATAGADRAFGRDRSRRRE